MGSNLRPPTVHNAERIKEVSKDVKNDEGCVKTELLKPSDPVNSHNTHGGTD